MSRMSFSSDSGTGGFKNRLSFSSITSESFFGSGGKKGASFSSEYSTSGSKLEIIQPSAFEDDLSQRRPVDEQVQKTLSLIIEHESLLQNINKATRDTIGDASDSHYRPIRIASEQQERVFPQDLVKFDNKTLRKVYSVLVFLLDEVRELKEIAEAKLYGPLIMFGQSPPEEEEQGSGASSHGAAHKERMVGKFLPTLQDVSNYIDRCNSVAVNIVQQLSALINAEEPIYRATFETTHLESVFSSLGKILSVLVTLDNIIQQNTALQDAWSYYKSLIAYARADPPSFGTSDAGVVSFERLLVSIDQSVMVGEIFKNCIEQNFESAIDEIGEADDGEIHINVRGNATFLQELLYCMKSQLDSALSIIGTNMELFERYDAMNSFVLYALYRRLLPSNIAPDAKLHSTLWGVQKSLPYVIMAEKVVWFLGEFLQEHAPYDIRKPDPPNPMAFRRTFLQSFDAALTQRTSLLSSQCAAWLILMESKFQPCMRYEPALEQALDVRGSIMLKGLALASRAENLAKTCLVMHSSMQVPLSRQNLNDVAVLVENLKSIEFTFVRKDAAIAEAQKHMLRGLCDGILSLVQPVRLKLDALVAEAQRAGRRNKLDSTRHDLLSTLYMVEDTIQSSESFSFSRQAVLKLAAEVVLFSRQFNEKDGTRMHSLVRRLCALASIPSDMKRICNTSFLYFEHSVFSSIVASIYQRPTEAPRLQYIVAAFCDGVRVFHGILHTDPEPFFAGYRDVLKAVVTKGIILPLSHDIETNLRLHIHSKHLEHMKLINPKADNFKPLRRLLELPPLRLLGHIVDIRSEVSHYLDLNFYNLTTVALHDWRTYSDMRSLASEKLGLDLMDNFLPMGSLDQGLDVLQIMRNIHIFVGRFTYNMNTQQFIEYRPDKASKHINTIKIQSIAASIRQHGLGVLNTTVNFTYQFLAQKFHIFSQFLFDEYIRAHLSREHRWYKKHKNEEVVSNMYPHDRALKLVRDIRKLGVNEAGKTFLDQFRILITEIGNALGYVRMVRSASMYYCSEAVKYLPEIDDVACFEKMAGKGDEGCAGADLPEETVRAARNLDKTIKCLVDNFGEGSDYFKVLVKVFQSVLLTQEHDHLRNFYMIVPSLCISWLEGSLQAKEAVYKVVRGPTKEMYFSDDGFAMGIAYCLAILKQTRKNDSLHWVDTVRLKYKADNQRLDESQRVRSAKQAAADKRKKGSGGIFGALMGRKAEEPEEDYEDQEEVHSLQVTAKRLEAQRRETEQLFYAMSGASIFFRRSDIDI